jgi:hypothetical protein
MITNGATPKVYHKDLGLPAVQLPTGKVQVTYTYHAQEAAKTDRYGHIFLASTLDLTNAETVEVTLVAGRLQKVLYRMTYSKTCDVCMVVDVNTWKVITVWLNSKTDNHNTLQVHKYTRP